MCYVALLRGPRGGAKPALRTYLPVLLCFFPDPAIKCLPSIHTPLIEFETGSRKRSLIGQDEMIHLLRPPFWSSHP